MNEMIERATKAFWMAALPGQTPNAVHVMLSHSQLESGIRAAIVAVQTAADERADRRAAIVASASSYTNDPRIVQEFWVEDRAIRFLRWVQAVPSTDEASS